MNTIFKKIFIVLFVLGIFTSSAFAQLKNTLPSDPVSDILSNTKKALDPVTTSTTNKSTEQPQGGAGGQEAQGGAGAGDGLGKGKTGLQITLTNPLKSDNLEDFIQVVLSVILRFLIPILAILFIYTGFQLVMARGNEKALATAKTNFFNLVIGAVLILGAWTFGNIILNTLREVGILN